MTSIIKIIKMRRWACALQAVTFAAFTVSTLAADVHQSCDSHRTDVIQALEEAIVMGQNGGDTISKQNTAAKSPVVMDLLYSLLGGKTDQDVLGKGATVTGTFFRTDVLRLSTWLRGQE